MKRFKVLFFIITWSFLALACGANYDGAYQTSASQEMADADPARLAGLSKAYFASGCFWCVEAIFESVRGVEEAVSGYSGGKRANPTYEQVSGGSTQHAEAVEVYYDPGVVSFATLVKVYYGSHNPTTVNGQHPDYGPQYRSVIFYTNGTEREIAESYKESLDASGRYAKPIATEIVPFVKFWVAEEYHQNYEKRNPNNPYIRNVSIPRLREFQAKFPELLKDSTKQH